MHRRRTRTIARLAVIALVAAALAVLAPQAAAPVAADGNEAPGAPLAFRSITAGDAHTCAILPSGDVKCWGINTSGQLGQDSSVDLGDGAGEMAGLNRVDLGAGRTASAVSAGNFHTCALLDNGTVKCWGFGLEGQLGQDSTDSVGDGPGEMGALAAVNLGAGRTATAVAAGNAHTCALLDNGTVKCWGAGASGQLGQDSTASVGEGTVEMAALAAVNLGAGRTATAVAAGNFHSCALLDNGTVKCWGAGAFGQLGQDSTAALGDEPGEMAALAPVNLGAGRTATAVTADTNHTCALLDDATIKCWGANNFGQLGQGSTADLGDGAGEMGALAAVNLGAGRTARAVSAGSSHTCALLDNATVKCWGAGSRGQLGQGSTSTLGNQSGEMAGLPAVNLGVGRTATAVIAGGVHTCAVLDDRAVKCWGDNAGGQLGQGSTATLGDQAGEMAALPAIDLIPLSVVLTADETRVDPGGVIHYHLTITAGSAARTGITIADPNAPACVQAVPDLAPGQAHTVDCSYATVGADYPSRANTATVDTAQTAPVSSNSVTVAVDLPFTATAVSAGNSHTCAVSDDGTVRCWGAGYDGRLGQGSIASLGDEAGEMAALVPVNLGAGRTATAVTAASHTCALLDDGTVKCWGNGSAGQLGQDSTATLGDQPGEMAALAPVNLGAGRTATAITVGNAHTCALLDDATVKCWGSGDRGRLGQDSTANLGDEPGEMAALAPVNLGAGRTATAVTAGAGHTCALLDDATVKCWGAGSTQFVGGGQLGQGSKDDLGDQSGEMAALAPVSLGAGRTATAVTAGTAHTCALLDDATVKCWGGGSNGRLGQDSTANLGDEAGEMAALAPVSLGVGRTATAVTAGNVHTCALLDDATVKCWGYGGDGRLGQDSTADLGDGPGEMAALAPVHLGYGSAGPATMSVVLAAEETTVVAGGTIHYHLTVTNTGVPAMSGFTVSDPNAPDCEQAIADLASGAQQTIDCTYTTTGADVGTYANVATVDTTETAPKASNTVNVTVTEAPAPSLSVVLSADEVSVSPGQVIHSHVVVSNTGNVGLHNVTVTDTKVPDCANDGAFDLAVGAFVTIDCEYTTTPNDAGTFEHKASVTADEVTTPVVSNQVDVTVDDAITVVMTANRSTVAVGSPVVFTIILKNTSTVPLSPPPTVVDEGVTDCVTGPMAATLRPGQELTVSCTFVPDAADIGTFSYTATADSPQIVAVESNQVDVTVEAAAPELTVEQTVAQTEVVAGDSIDLTVTLTNTGNVDLHGVVVADPAAPECEDGPFTLVVGVEYDIECTHVTTGADVPRYENTASVTATELTAPVVSNTVSVAVSIPAGAAHVAGTVTETGSGDPIAGAVAALLSPVDYSPVAVATTNDAGRFSALVAPGSYFVYVLDPADAHAPGFHGAPTPVTASADSTTDADTALAATRGTIAGAVTDDASGDPLAGILAMGIDLDAGGPGAGALTDGDGTFTITGLRAGARLVEYVDLTGAHRPEFFDDAPTPAGSSVVSVVGASQANADAGLASQAAPVGGAHLVGAITSTTGGPLEGVAVMAVHTTDLSLAAGVLTDSAGHYDLDLDAGDYKVAVYDPAGAHSFEWFDDQGPNGLADAATVTAIAGSPETVDTAMTPTTAAVAGTVTETGTGVLLADVAVFAIDATGTVVGVTTTAADGTYTLVGVPPGDHRVRFVDLTGTHTSEYFDDSPGYDGASLIDAAAGATTPEVDAELSLAG